MSALNIDIEDWKSELVWAIIAFDENGNNLANHLCSKHLKRKQLRMNWKKNYIAIMKPNSNEFVNDFRVRVSLQRQSEKFEHITYSTSYKCKKAVVRRKDVEYTTKYNKITSDWEKDYWIYEVPDDIFEYLFNNL